jgi:hypothetical protein
MSAVEKEANYQNDGQDQPEQSAVHGTIRFNDNAKTNTDDMFLARRAILE